MHKAYLTGCLLLLSANAMAGEMVTVPGGSFNMGCSSHDKDCASDEGTMGGVPVNVPTFQIDKYEVTVAEYQQCMAAGKCTRPKDHQLNQYCNLGDPDRLQHPVNCVDWREAKAYCEYEGKRLPNEAEWEKAARAGTTSRYPWGQEVDCSHAILDDSKTLATAGNEHDGCGYDRTWKVGSRAPNALGIYDMQGNAGEWTANWYVPDAITAYYAKGNLHGPASGVRRVVRGGSWDEVRENLRSSFRNVKLPDSGESIYGSIGFRCAR